MIQKLGRAIREYRGAYRPHPTDPNKGTWVRPPNPSAWRRIDVWLDRLMVPTDAARKSIDGFQSLDEMAKWLKDVEDYALEGMTRE